MSSIDMTAVLRTTTAALDLAQTVDGTEVQTYRDGLRNNDKTLARAARDLLRISNLLALAAAEAENQYHLTRGYEDPYDDKD